MSKSNLNKILLVGSLGRDPEVRTTPKGHTVANLSLATNRRFKDKDGNDQEETTWHRATVWGKHAENCAKYLTKGSRVFIEGELQMKDWTDKDGKARKTAEVHVNSIQFLGGAKSSGTPAPEMSVVQ